jgi:hypothetical protein
LPKFGEFPVSFPSKRDLGVETSSQLTWHSTKFLLTHIRVRLDDPRKSLI